MKLMKPVMGSYVPSCERTYGALGEALKSRLLKMSGSSIDRVLKSARIVAGPRRKILARVVASAAKCPSGLGTVP